MDAVASALLDTTVVVDHLRGKAPSIADRFKETHNLYMPVMVLGELLYGAYRSASRVKALKQIEDFMQLCVLLEPHDLTAHYYGRINAALAHAGKAIPQNDVWIAAMALEHSLPLATRDRHFSLVANLTILAW